MFGEEAQIAILSGGFWAVFLAFIGGMVTFFTPCVLPIVPPYLAFMTGYSVAELKDGEKRGVGRVLSAALLFVLGFSIVFVTLGLAFTAASQWLRGQVGSLQLVAGTLIFLMGLIIAKPPLLDGWRKAVLSWAGAIILIAAAVSYAPAQAVLPPILVGLALLLVGFFSLPVLYSDVRFNASGGQRAGLLKAFLMGLAFAFGWTACTGPILAAVLMGAGEYAQNTTQGAVIMLGFAAGLAVPFVVTAVAVDRALSLFQSLRAHMGLIEFGAAVMLMIAGLAMYAGWIAKFALWMEAFIPAI